MGLPRDASEWLACALAILVAACASRLAARADRARVWVAVCAVAAGALSAAYIALYLRGGPRIIDATSYWLEARAFAAGGFGRWPLPEPEAATMGRFLLRTEIDGAPAVAPIFPPGWPVVLSLGFLAGAPMAVGPLLAATLCVPTWVIARRAGASLCAAGVVSAQRAALVAPVAVALSVVCAALRYHTADTMAHGLSALCWAGAVAAGWASTDAALQRRRRLVLVGVAGLCAGWLCATRPTSALGLTLLVAVVVLARPAAQRRAAYVPLLVALAAAIPGVLLLVLHQRALTGSFGGSSQLAYYAASDGPAGCFRYGFGGGIGCLGEHGDFVRARLGDGFGALAAAGTTLRRLKQHLVDAGNLDPLALLLPAAVVLGWRARALRWLGLAVALQVAVYIPFYFDGNYPGGGARFFADVLPIEHALLACASVCIAERARARLEAPLWLVALALFGFAVRGGRHHSALRDREGGRPMFEPALVAALPPGAMLFVDTDHGFALAARPEAPQAVARRRGDAIDAMAWDAAGRPPAFAYTYDPGTVVAAPSVTALDLAVAARLGPGGRPTVEGESLWPPRTQARGHAVVEHASGTCASAGRWLALVPDDRRPSSADGVAARAEPNVVVDVALPAPWMQGRGADVIVALSAGSSVELQWWVDRRPHGAWGVVPAGPGLRCVRFTMPVLPIKFEYLDLQIAASIRGRGPGAALDAVVVTDAAPPPPPTLP